MNTNHEDTGVTVALRKTGHIVHLDVSTIAGTVGIKLDDTKSVYTAMHEAKDGIAEMVSRSIDKMLSYVTETSPVVPEVSQSASLDGITGLVYVTSTDAAAVLDGKQVATPVNVDDSYEGRIEHGGFFAQPVLDRPDFGVDLTPKVFVDREELSKMYAAPQEDIDAAHSEALAEDAARSEDNDEPPTKTETPAGKRPRKPKAA